MTTKRLTFNDGEPKLVITVVGHSDVFRFAWAMQHLQCDFADVGFRVYDGLKRRMGAKRFRQLEEHFTGRKPLA